MRYPLSLHKLTAIIESLPDYARITDDGIYGATDVYLKNDQLPVQKVTRVLYSEQLRLKKPLSGDSEEGLLDFSWTGVQIRAVSPRDLYASLRRENRELKLEIARMRVRVRDLDKEQMSTKRKMMEKSGNNDGTFLTSFSKGIGRNWS
ncbi:putative BTB/POZ domain-containing protein [Raphanus sativus]|nr:putative BTB/POZ domain-containing protein [Raphanus sativus]